MTEPHALATTPRPDGAVNVQTARAELHASRDRVLQELQWVRSTLKYGPDWRALARKHPLAVTLGVLAVGLVVAQLFRRR